METEQTEEEVVEPEVNGVMIQRTIDPAGNVQVALQLLGDARISEVQFILEQGIKAYRKQFGL